MTYLSKAARERIIHLLTVGVSSTAVSRRFGVSGRTVRLIGKQFRDAQGKKAKSPQVPAT